MDESEENISADDIQSVDSPQSFKAKPKKRSLVERELETNLTARVTSPVTSDGTSTSRYGRARRLKIDADFDTEKVMKPLRIDTSKSQPQAYKMHASNSPIRKESPKRAVSTVSSLDDQIENIYNENISLSRFGSEEQIKQMKAQSPAKKYSKIYIRKDLIQKPDTDTVTLIKNMFSPTKSNTHLNNILERSSEKYSLNGHGKPRNGFPDTSSVVKTLDFDGKKKKDVKDANKDKPVSKNKLFELEATCPYQVGDLAWARVGTYPFWPCIITREPFTDMFVKKKLFGRIEHDVIHVTFFGDNGRRGWIVDNMLRKYSGKAEFEASREKFTPEAKKKDPRLYAAYFVSEKKLPLWNVSVEEAETIQREPKRLRIDVFHDMLEKTRASKTTPKREKGGKISRTDSDVSLSESLYDTLFSEDDGKVDDTKRTKKSKKKSLDVSEVVTACLDNMAAKSGIIKIQKQSHMDRWLQKAKSKTPEKSHIKTDKEKSKEKTKKKSKETRKPKLKLDESLSSDKNLLPHQNEHDYSSVNYENHDINDRNIKTDFEESAYAKSVDSSSICIIEKIESLSCSMEESSQDDIITTEVNDDIVLTDADHVNKEMASDEITVDKIITNSVHENNTPNAEKSVESIKEISDNINKDRSNRVMEKVVKSSAVVCNTPTVENITNSTATEEIEIKVEFPVKTSDIVNEKVLTRRSRRKRQSDIEKNDSMVDGKIMNSIVVVTNTNHINKEISCDGENVVDKIISSIVPEQTTSVGSNLNSKRNRKVSDNSNKETIKNTENAMDKIHVNSVLENNISDENIASIDGIQEIEIKVELPVRNSVVEKEKTQTRRSSRKRQSGVEKNDLILGKNIEKVNIINTACSSKETVDDKTVANNKLDNNVRNIGSTTSIEIKEIAVPINKEKRSSTGNDKSKPAVKTMLDSKTVDNSVTSIETKEKNCNAHENVKDKTAVNSVPENKTVERSNSYVENKETEVPAKTSLPPNDGKQTKYTKKKRPSDVEKSVSIVDSKLMNSIVVLTEADNIDKKITSETLGTNKIITNVVLESNMSDLESNICIKIEEITDTTEVTSVDENTLENNITEPANSETDDELPLKIKVKLPLKGRFKADNRIKTRRSKKKRLSDMENRNSIVDNNLVITDTNDVSKEINGKNEDASKNTFSINNTEIADRVNEKVTNDSETYVDKSPDDTVAESETPRNKDVISIDEKVEIKVELLGSREKVARRKSSVTMKDELQTRRSKRKRQSDAENNDSIIDKKIAKVPKLDKESKISQDLVIDDSNIVMNNTDHERDVLHLEKTEIQTETKNAPNTSEINEEHVRRNSFQLHRPQPIVIVEPLNISTLETKVIMQNNCLDTDAKTLNNGVQAADNTVDLPKTEDIVDQSSSVQVEPVESTASDIPNESNSKIVENSSNNVLDALESFELQLSDSDKKKDLGVDNAQISNDDEAVVNQDVCEKMDDNVSETMNIVNDNQNNPSCVTDTKASNINMEQTESEEKETVESLMAEITNLTSDIENKVSNKPGATSVVIGEETYFFDRTLSQDYDEIESDKYDANNSESVHSTAQEVNNEDTDVFKTRAFVFEIYDDIENDSIEDTVKDSHINGPKYNDAVNQIPSEKSFSDVGCDKNLEPMESPDKGSSKLDETTDNAEVSITDVKCDNVPLNNVNVNKDNETVETRIEEDNNLPPLSRSEDGLLLSNHDEISHLENENIIAPSVKADSFDEKINEVKEKKQKSPRLSLKRSKNKMQNQDTDHETTKESNEILLHTQNTDTPSEDKTSVTDKPETEAKDSNIETTEDGPNSQLHEPIMNGFIESKESTPVRKIKEEFDAETASIKSEDSSASTTRRKARKEKQDVKKAMDDPEFLKYLELRQDALIDEQPELSQDEIVTYLYQTWLYEESNKSDRKKTDEVEQSKLVKGLNQDPPPQPRKYKKKIKVEKEANADIREMMPKEKPKRKATQSKPYYNEDFSDLEEEDLETFNIYDSDVEIVNEDGQEIDEVELYFEKLKKPKPNVFKGFVREKVCEICELTNNLVKCKTCHGTFHPDCVKKEEQIVEIQARTRGRKKKKTRGRKPKGYAESLIDSGSQSDEKSQDPNSTEEFNVSLEDEFESHIAVDEANFEAQWELKMKELQPEPVDDFESDQEVHWDLPPGECEIVDIKHKEVPVDYSNFKCNNCEKYETPVCFVCKSAKSPKGSIEVRQKCQVAHCHRYYHLECLDHWPQTQFNSWEPSKTNKKVIEYVEALSCPRHVCHTCVSDDPRGCKTRFCGDKLARCVKCPATYHAFTKCLPAGTQILTGSQIVCPRHYEHRAGKVPCHVNTGWCFICALGGTLICCEYCPTSFHAECLNIKPPEGSYMCEDCETGRLPLYGEMVWVKLGHYRWWPGIVLHPSEIPDNIMAVKHSPGEFVVRFFGQYDHYWVNRGRVFPFQEGDSGRISSQKSKIDAAFTTAMEHAQRACEILKNVEPNEEEEEDIAASLLPPHYVKLKANKPVGSLTARRDIDANSLTQCDCDPTQPDPCGPYSHCLNRMLLTECGPLCRAGDRCNNRAFERRDYPRLAPYRTPQRGWGLKTLEDIKQGQFVIEYVGELIDEEEFRRRMCRKHEIRDENFYFLTLDKERMIDAGPKGNLARFMNHCCEPNCETQKWTVLGDVRVGLFAMRDIPANSEVTFNYNLECAGIEKKRCLCGAKRCSGYIGAKPKQEEVQPKKLKVPAKRTYKKRKNIEDSPSSSKIKPPIKIKITKPVKPRELTEIEKDLLIIKNATNGMSSDSEGSRLSSVDEKKDAKALKRKRVSFSTEETISNTSVKKIKLNDDAVGD